VGERGCPFGRETNPTFADMEFQDILGCMLFSSVASVGDSTELVMFLACPNPADEI